MSLFGTHIGDNFITVDTISNLRLVSQTKQILETKNYSCTLQKMFLTRTG